MKPKYNFVNLIILIVFIFMFKWNNALNLAQSGLCNLDSAANVPNICNHSKYLVYGIEVESGCFTPGTKCWCILVNNRNRAYDGEMVIELVQIFNREKLPDEIQFDDVKSYLSFQILSGINQILVQSYIPPEGQSNITSIKLGNIEICKFNNSDIQQTTNNSIQLSPDDDSLDEEYRYFADCMHRKEYTENSIMLCPNYRPEFMIEKRFTQNNSAYWCININNDKYSLTSANHLNIVYSSPNRYFVYSPLDAYTEGEVPGSDFHLGNQRTIIAISKNNNQLADLRSVTIDHQPICSYFEPPEITPVIIQGIDKSDPDILGPQIPPRDIPGPKIPGPDIPKPNINRVNSMNTCGIKPLHKNFLISYGFNTNPGDWPWHAAIYKQQTKSNRIYICGGTLINLKSIVTAAHCIIEINQVVIPERLSVELGRYDLTIFSTATQEYRVNDIIPHEAYNPDSFENDIAILVLKNSVQLTKYVNFVCLPNHNDNLQNKIGTTVGWGRESKNQIQADLKETYLPVIDRIVCLASNRNFFSQYLTSTNFCAGNVNKTDVCRGSSGGGLVFKSKGKWFLGGITSIGVPLESVDHDCDLSQYVIFTDVTKFIKWIKRKTV